MAVYSLDIRRSIREQTETSAQNSKEIILKKNNKNISLSSNVPACLYPGVISGALLQLRTEFELNCQQTELVVSALLIGALIASLSGGLSLCSFFYVCLSICLSN